VLRLSSFHLKSSNQPRTDKDSLLGAGAVTLKRDRGGSFFLCMCACTDSVYRGGGRGEGRRETRDQESMNAYLAQGPGQFDAATGNFAQHVAQDLACLCVRMNGAFGQPGG